MLDFLKKPAQSLILNGSASCAWSQFSSAPRYVLVIEKKHRMTVSSALRSRKIALITANFMNCSKAINQTFLE